MNFHTITHPFQNIFLADFILVKDSLPFNKNELNKLDIELSTYERAFFDPDIESSLFTKNELLASFAISKAENSQLTLSEAKAIYQLVLDNPDFDFVVNQLRQNNKLNRKDYEKMEFFNIVKTFRYINTLPATINQFDVKFIKNIHRRLTQGLDIFHQYLSGFDVYRSGFWRDNDKIRVGDYKPAKSENILKLVAELIAWLKKDFTVQNIAIFHTALYAVHPFCNGNKRACRILEHLLLRILGFNAQNLYSTSYYYHKQKDRYYKYLIASLNRKHLNYFSAFVLEAAALSILGVLKTSIEFQRQQKIDEYRLDHNSASIAKHLVKRKELSFKNLYRRVKNKMARQTFATRLKKMLSIGCMQKRGSGKKVYYSLSLRLSEEKLYKTKWLELIKNNLKIIPDEFSLVV